MSGAPDLSGMTFAIIGGGGFIGAHLALALKARNATVKAYGRTRYFDEPLAGVDWMSGTLDDLQKLATFVDGADVVIHLAGTSTPASAEASRISDVATSIGGAITVLDLCRNAKIERVIFASSGGTVYGDALSPPFSEDVLPRPISSYGINKLAAEMYFGLYNRTYGMRNVVLRISNPFGPYQHGLKNQGVIPIFIRNALQGQTIRIWGDGSVTRDYLYGGDVAEAAIAAALYEGQEHVFNIGSGVGRSLNDVVASISDTLGTDLPVEYVGSRAIDVPTSVLDCARAKKELGWSSATGWMHALATTTEWVRKEMQR